jgi:excinuclease ABC subunit B
VTSPEDYERMLLTVKRGQQISREAVLGRLVNMLYERNDVNFVRADFEVRGDVVEVYPATADEEAVRLEFFGDELDAITAVRALNRPRARVVSMMHLLPGETVRNAGGQVESSPLTTIRAETRRPDQDPRRAGEIARGATAEKCGLRYDLEMLQEMGFCNGIENYCRHLSGRPPGSKPFTPCSIFSRKIFSSWLMNRTPPSRRSAGCMKAIVPAKPCWSSTASGCRARSITAAEFS